MNHHDTLANAVMKHSDLWHELVDPTGYMGNSIGLAQQVDFLYDALDEMSDYEKRQLAKRLGVNID